MALSNAERQQGGATGRKPLSSPQRQRTKSTRIRATLVTSTPGFIARSIWYNTRWGDWIRQQRRILAEAGAVNAFER